MAEMHVVHVARTGVAGHFPAFRADLQRTVDCGHRFSGIVVDVDGIGESDQLGRTGDFLYAPSRL